MRQVLIAALLVCGLPAAEAQISPVKLKVTKNVQKDMERSAQLVRENVSYAIEVSHHAAAPVDVVVRWGMLVTPGWRFDGSAWRHVGQQILEGERPCRLERMQKCVFDTDTVELAAYSKKPHHYNRYKSEITASYVEALVNGVVVASDIQPANGKLRIQEEKEKKKPR